jgi:transcriptional regulator of NAD metabolism
VTKQFLPRHWQKNLTEGFVFPIPEERIESYLTGYMSFNQRENGKNIFSTNRGYLIQEDEETTRVFKVQHEDDEVEKELTTIVDLGGTVEDVFVYHKVYGVLRAEMNIKSRMDIRNYMEEIRSGKSSLLKNVTSGYHYHTVRAERVEILDMIQEELQKKGLLAKLQDYEPVDFWGQNNYNE